MTKTQQAEQVEAIAELRKIVKPGDTLYTILRHTSRSGMMRHISVVHVSKRGETQMLDWLVSRACGMKLATGWNGEGLKVDGCGMDMGFHVVYTISAVLYGGKRGYPCLGDRCPSNSHVNDRSAPRGKGVRHHDGYALNHRWM